MTPSEARQKLGLSITEMAQLCGVHRQTWTKWERGERSPDAAAVRLVSLLAWLHEDEPGVFARLPTLLLDGLKNPAK